MKIKAEHIDSFQIRRPSTRKLANNENPRCAFKGCKRAGHVVLFYTLEKERGKQLKDRICVNHALDLANEVLMKYKFNRE